MLRWWGRQVLRHPRRDPLGLGQAERLRKFPRGLGPFPLSFLAKPQCVPAPPVTFAPASPHHLQHQEIQNVPVSPLLLRHPLTAPRSR